MKTLLDNFRIDSHKLAYHPERVAALVEAGSNWNKHKELRPIYAEISSSGACNHRCTFCSVDYIGYNSVFLARETLRRFFESSQKIGLKAVMFAGDGEPLLNKDISGIISDATYYGIDTSFTTNGVHMSKEFVESSMPSVSWIKVSMNAGNKDIYAKVHRTRAEDFERVWDNISYAIRSRNNNGSADKGSCTIGIQSLILPDNIHSLSELAERCAGEGVDYLVLKPYVHNQYMKQEGYYDIDYSVRIYNEVLESIQQKWGKSLNIVARTNALEKLIGNEERYKKCWSTPALWFYISGDGSVYSCGAHVGNPHFKLGNINDEQISDVWKSDQRKKNLEFVQNELDLATCRRTCRMDEANKYLSDLLDGKIKHKNFI